ncbi:penicillin-binding protein activator [Amylibacter sp. IMCC11727]|uniref:penicillin-binding protein activator n=1 Tax=Amylibacter sp. IMCC11727 TaxID=3039851 RepID=UPI00244DDDDA|nr:penicillin-binding protein activator [Amylibacter sp. IMCC11727]WGI21599.1 penicillin-binding protein activator [Amylibacter sp. IMCC11727]
MAALHHFKKLGRHALGALGVGLLLSGCIETNTASQGPKVNTSQPVVVGLMVPSGSGNAQTELLANSLISAAKLAVAEMPDAKIDMRVYSTGGDANQAAAAAQRAANDGAKILVGPLFAQASNAAGTAVAGNSINVLSFSNNPDIAGGNVFILGDTFANTANRVVGYAASQGKKSIAALVRADAAGTVAANAVESAAKSNGAAYVGVAKYELTNESAVAAISATKGLIQQTGATALVMDADAAGALPVFAQLLPEAGISSANTQFIGLTRWDKTSEQVRASTGVQGALFAMTDTSATSSFSQRYSATYGSSPHLLAGKAYDGMRAVGTLLQTGSRDALTRSALTRNAGFSGANGVFRFRPDGTNQRALAVATFREGQVVVVDPAPRSFGGAGF